MMTNTTFTLIRREFAGKELAVESFDSYDSAARFYADKIKINNRFDTFYVVDKIVDGKFACRALIFGLLKNLEK